MFLSEVLPMTHHFKVGHRLVIGKKNAMDKTRLMFIESVIVVIVVIGKYITKK